jgi:hypothetical protein
MPAIIGESPMEYFRIALAEAMARERVSVETFTEYYIVQLLVGEIDRGHHPTETLGDSFVKALAAKPADRQRMLRWVGDRALLFNGLWWEHNFRPRRISHLRFHRDVGMAAYRNLGGVPFEEMSLKFEGIVDALARLGTDASLATARDLVRLFLLWQETHSAYAARVLAERGLIPIAAKDSVPS